MNNFNLIMRDLLTPTELLYYKDDENDDYFLGYKQWDLVCAFSGPNNYWGTSFKEVIRDGGHLILELI